MFTPLLCATANAAGAVGMLNFEKNNKSLVYKHIII